MRTTPAAAAPSFSKSDYAYGALKARIFDGSLPAGGVVSQERVAAEMGISTTPVREALKRLATEGLVTLAVHRDARVTELSTTEARSLLEVRLELDPLAVRLAAGRRTDDDVRRMRTALDALEPLTDDTTVDGLYAHRDFHRSLYSASGNAPLVEILDGLWDKADRYRMQVLRESPRTDAEVERVRSEHVALVEHVEAGDEDAAADTMLRHVRHSLGRRATDEASN